MKVNDVKKILILDQGNSVAYELLDKAAGLFGENDPEIIVLKAHRTHNLVLHMMEETIRNEKPELVLIGATALGEEIAPALGVRFRTGIAAHCVDIKAGEDGSLTFMIPAFGGKVIGEIFVPDTGPNNPAIATIKPGMLGAPDEDRLETIYKENHCRTVDIDSLAEDGSIPEGTKTQGAFRLTEVSPREHTSGDIAKAKIIVCGGFGLGDEAVWHKLETLAQKLGGAAACTRAALDAGWGCDPDTMIGTSGRAVRPKVYIGFGISGAAHHTCGITGADTIISINSDKDAEVFRDSDHKGVFDAEKLIDALLEEIG